MTETIKLSAEFEPESFYANTPSSNESHVLSVVLGFTSDDADSAQAANSAFLNAVKDCRFLVYSFIIDPNDTSRATLVRETQIRAETKEWASPVGLPNELENWLGDRPGNRWNSAPPSVGTVITQSEITASPLLDAVANWPAPLPQAAGLTRLVRLSSVNSIRFENLVIIPWFNAGEPSEPLPPGKASKVPRETNQYDIVVQIPGFDGLAEYHVSTRSLKQPVADPGSLIDPATGYLQVRHRNRETAAALKRIREYAPTLLWTFPQILSLLPDDKTLSNASAVLPTMVLDDFKRAVWLGISGLATLLDPLLLSLTMAGTPREGPLISALIALIEAENENASQPLKVDLTNLVSDITRAVENCAGVDNPGGTAQPKELASALIAAFDLDFPEATRLAEHKSLLPVLLRVFYEYAPADLPSDFFDFKAAELRFGHSLERQLLIELSLLGKTMQEESAIEAAGKRVLEYADIVGLLTNRVQGTDSTDDAKKSHAQNLLTRFWGLLEQSFNGLDATRFAQGSLMEAALVKHTAATISHFWSDTDLKNGLATSDWFKARAGFLSASATPPQPGSSFAAIAAHLPLLSPDWLSDETKTDFKKVLEDGLAAIVTELFPNPTTRRFLPDSAPRNIPVQIAVDTDIFAGEAFQQRYNGVAILVRRKGNSEPAWRYGNLAELKLSYMQDGAFSGQTIEPLQPVAVDGQSNLFFDFAGVPLASRAFEETKMLDAPAKPALATFYTADDPESPIGGPLPALAYGNTYNIAAHVVSKAGVLPIGLQRTADEPWLPKDPPAGPGEDSGLFYEYEYHRTTAVGRVTLTEQLQDGATARIGAEIKGVVPLSSDYPRLHLAAPENRSATLDILRNSDGTGAISLPKTDSSVDLTIKDVWWWGGGALSVAFLSRPDALPDANGTASCVFVVDRPLAGGSIAIRIEKNADNYIYKVGFSQSGDAMDHLEVVSEVIAAGSVWLRLKLRGETQPSDAGTSKASISFADPTRDILTENSASGPASDSLVVMAPSDMQVWREAFKKEISAVIHLPQTSFVDFDRWFSNRACRAIAFPKQERESEDEAEARRDAFHEKIMTAYVGRMLDPRLAALVDHMPDLAVEGLRLELAPLDGLAEAPSKLVRSFSASSSAPDRSPLFLQLNIPPLGNRIDHTKPVYKMLSEMAAGSSVQLKVRCEGNQLKLDKSPDSKIVTVTVPAGLVARLKIRAMVNRRFFNEGSPGLPIFDPGIKQLAVDRTEDTYLFEGPILTVEAMIGELANQPDNYWTDLAEKALTVRPAGLARSYDLLVDSAKLDEDGAWRWRELGTIDTTTQRWRFTGRPIYSWFDPKRKKPGYHPALRIDDDMPGVREFEKEAFFDRDEADADTQTKRLDPAPAATLLQSFPWEPPSATFFRHRLTLRSRYAGALLPKAKSTQKAYTNERDWIRVAMLADASRLQLTRPQLRALLPLTITPSTNGSDAATPPVMAVLEEPPFAHGGLADRISAEIVTGFGFGFDNPSPPLDDSSPLPVHIVDSRKEIGPDPRLSYQPTPAEMAHALTIETEGPIGLTFDTPTAPAPAFANCAYLLRPRLAREDNVIPGTLEEHFLSVAMRRYLDHRWLVDQKIEQPTPHPIALSAWVEFDQDFSLSADNLKVLEVTRTNTGKKEWLAKFAPRAIDPKGPGPTDPGKPEILPPTHIATASTRFANQLALLHLPLEDGRASLTLFALPETKADRSGTVGSTATGTGESNLPHVMASFEWTIPPGVKTLKINKATAVFPTAASPVTRMNWTRTGKSFDMIEGFDEKGKEERIAVSELIGRRDRANDALNLVRTHDLKKLLPSPQLERNPLFVHRHAAVVATVWAEGTGRPIEVFQAARRVIGNDLNIPTDRRPSAGLRVITFETPARPLVAGCSIAEQIAHMASAVFDVFAIVGDKYPKTSKSDKGLAFIYRPLGDTTGKNPLQKFGFRLSIALSGGGNSSGEFTAAITEAHHHKKLSAFHFLIAKDSGEATWTAVFTDGSTEAGSSSLGRAVINLQLSEFETIVVKPTVFADTNGPIKGEFWGDISMLTIPSGGPIDTFSWDWFFSGSDQDPNSSVTPASLAAMHEVEARIIAVSPPIPIISH